MELLSAHICFAADGESRELQLDGNDGMQRWTRRLMQERTENQSRDQARAGEPVGCGVSLRYLASITADSSVVTQFRAEA